MDNGVPVYHPELDNIEQAHCDTCCYWFNYNKQTDIIKKNGKQYVKHNRCGKLIKI